MFSLDSWHHNDPEAHVIHERYDYLQDEPINRERRIEDLFFPVSLRPLYWEMDNDCSLVLKECERHFAVVDEERRLVFSAVTEDYNLVTNEEAFIMGRDLAEAILIPYRDESLGCIDFLLTSNRAACEIDIARKVQVGQPLIAGEWIPIIRVINSYNKTRALEFNIGFFNPMDELHIMSNKPLKFPHNAIKNRKKFREWIEMVRKSNKVQDEIRAFEQKMNTLRNIQLSPTIILQLFSLYFEVFINTTKKYEAMSDAEQFAIDMAMEKLRHADHVNREFGRKYGANGYSLLLVLAACIERDVNGKLRTTDQQKLGKWSDELIVSTQASGFSWFDYIGREAANTITYYEMNK